MDIISPRRSRRPAAHFLNLDDIFTVLETAWNLAREAGDNRTYANALRVEVATMTGLRIGELHNLRPADIRPDGTLNVRMLLADDSPWGRGLKYAKPRVTAWVNGQETSPTYTALRRYIDGDHRPKGRPIGPESRLWPSTPKAWWHWCVHRLGPATGLQRLLPKLDGTPADKGTPRYLIHPHTWRACFVMICRRYPRRLGLEPVPWDAICALGGWDSVETIMRSYYYADLDETLHQLRRSIPASQAPAPARPEIPTNPHSWGR